METLDTRIDLVVDATNRVGDLLDETEEKLDHVSRAQDRQSRTADQAARAQDRASRSGNRMNRVVEKSRRGIAALTKRMLPLLAAYLSVTAAANAFTRSMEMGQQVVVTSEKVGASAEFLQVWRFAAQQVGIASDTADMALQRFSRRVGEARKGTGELLPTLEDYNIQLNDSEGNARDLADILGDLGRVVQATEDPTERLRIAFKAFDSEGAALVSVLRQGEEGMIEFAEQAEESGVILDGKYAAALDRAKKRTDTFIQSAKVGIGNMVAEMFMAFEELARFNEQRKETERIRKQAIEEIYGRSFGSGRGGRNEMQRKLMEDPIEPEVLSAQMEKIRNRESKARIKAYVERQNQLQEELAATRDIAEQERIKKENKEITAEIAKMERDLAFEQLSAAEQQVILEERLAQLWNEANDETLSLENRKKALEQIFQIKLDILRLDEAQAGKSGGSGGDDGDGEPEIVRLDPIESVEERMKDVLDPQVQQAAYLNDQFRAMSESIEGLITGTMTWGTALENIGGSILNSVIQSFSQMAAAYITQKLIMLAFDRSTGTASAGMATKQGAAAYAAWAPAAIAASIASGGVAAATGTAAFLSSLFTGTAAGAVSNVLTGVLNVGSNAVSAIPGYAAGGLVPSNQKIIQINEEGMSEFVANGRATQKNRRVLEMMNQGLDVERDGFPGGRGSAPSQIFIVGSEEEARNLAAEIPGEVEIRKLARDEIRRYRP